MKPATSTNKQSSSSRLRKPVLRVSLMKPLLSGSAILGLVVLGLGVANANILYNTDLDNIGAAGANGQINPGPVGWVIDASKSLSGGYTDGADSETWCNVEQPGGYGLFFKPFAGSTNSNPALDDLLTVYFYQDNPSSPGTKYTLSGYAACEANFCGLFPAPPGEDKPLALFFVEFLDDGGNVISSNAFDLVANGMSTAGPSSMGLLTMPEYTAPAGTVTVRAGASLLNAYSTTGAQSFFVDSFDLEAVAPPGSPVITNQPAGVAVTAGGTAVFDVGVSNTAGVTYEWQKDGNVLSDGGNIAGSTTATLTISDVSTNDIGHYRAVVANSTGTQYSSIAPLAVQNLAINPVFNLTGTKNDTYEVDYTTSLNSPVTWIPLSTNKLTSASFQVVDPVSALSGQRYYRAIFLY